MRLEPPHTSLADRRARRTTAGFTLLEVMVSLGVMTVGGLAIIALQTHVIRANSQARQLTIATQIAETWISRLKEDGARWTTTPAATSLPNTQYLKDILNSPGQYVAPPDYTGGTLPAGAPLVSRGFDFFGNDLDTTAGNQQTPYFCAGYRLQWVMTDEAIRADVRVWWPRAGTAANMASDFGNDCGASKDLTIINPGGSRFGDYHVVYVSTVINRTNLER